MQKIVKLHWLIHLNHKKLSAKIIHMIIRKKVHMNNAHEYRNESVSNDTNVCKTDCKNSKIFKYF